MTWRPSTRASTGDASSGSIPVACQSSSVTFEMSAATSSGGFHAIVHLAALSNDPLGDFGPTLTLEINRDMDDPDCAAKYVTWACGRSVFMSSLLDVRRVGERYAPLAEDAPLRPMMAYAESKVGAEAWSRLGVR